MFLRDLCQRKGSLYIVCRLGRMKAQRCNVIGVPHAHRGGLEAVVYPAKKMVRVPPPRMPKDATTDQGC